MLDVRWYGRGGQGAFTAARLLGQIVSVYGGQFALASPSFGPERRGAPVWSFTKIDAAKIVDRSIPTKCDYLVVLDETLLSENTKEFIAPHGTMVINTVKPEQYSSFAQKVIALPATDLALEFLGRPITNVAMLGALLGVSSLAILEHAENVLQASFSKSLAEKNIKLLHHAYSVVQGACHE